MFEKYRTELPLQLDILFLSFWTETQWTIRNLKVLSYILFLKNPWVCKRLEFKILVEMDKFSKSMSFPDVNNRVNRAQRDVTFRKQRTTWEVLKDGITKPSISNVVNTVYIRSFQLDRLFEVSVWQTPDLKCVLIVDLTFLVESIE